MYRRHQSELACFTGFTLNELIISMAVAAILMTAAVPSLRSYVVNTKLSAGTNALIGSLNFARSEAIKRGVPVSICASSNGVFCTLTPWGQGWMVFVDEGTPGLVDGDDEVLVGGSGFGDSIELSLGGPNYIRFQPNGGLVSSCDVECAPGPSSPVMGRTSLLAGLLHLLPISSAYAHSDDDDSDDHPGKGGDNGDGGKNKNEMTDPGPAPSSVTFEACHGGNGRAIAVSALGRISVVDIDCPD